MTTDESIDVELYMPALTLGMSYLPRPIRYWAQRGLYIKLCSDLSEVGLGDDIAGTVELVDGRWTVYLRVPPDGPLEQCFIHEVAHIFAGEVKEALFGGAHAERERRTRELVDEWVREATTTTTPVIA